MHSTSGGNAAISTRAAAAQREGRFRVVHSKVAVRAAPSTQACAIHVAFKGDVYCGREHEIDGHPWLLLDPRHSNKFSIQSQSEEAWMLIHGAQVGLGDLLRPLYKDVEVLEELLWRLSGDKAERVRPVVSALKKANVRFGSELLRRTGTTLGLTRLQTLIEQDIHALVIPNILISLVRIAVEDSRLAFSGFPNPPPWSKTRILFTAPHSLPLCRPGHRPHVPEARTSGLARGFAETVGGVCLTWTQKEEERAKRFFRKKGRPDPTNKDPNFTHQRRLSSSPWTRNLREIKTLFDSDRPCLHIDLHGCKDPGPSGGSHLVVGLRAMEFAHKVTPCVFRRFLEIAFAAALPGWSVNLQPRRQLTGALEDDHCTLTQQSLSEEGGAWMWAVQLEMSRALRTYLASNTTVQGLVAEAIMYAWTIASHRDVKEPDRFVHHCAYWLARCKQSMGKDPPAGLSLSPPSVLAEDGPAETEGVNAAAATADSDACPGELECEEEAESEAAEATANTEPRPSAFDGSFKDVEEEMLKAARGLGDFSDPYDRRTRAQHPTAVTLLRDWFQSDVERPSQQYSVIGSWDSFVKPVPMEWDGVRFVYLLAVRGRVQFQILLDGDWNRVIYPSVAAATLNTRHAICGPDSNAHDYNWCIGNESSSSVDAYEVILWITKEGHALRVTWQRQTPNLTDKDEDDVCGRSRQSPSAGYSAQEFEVNFNS